MIRFRLALVIAGALCLVSVADDKPKPADDPAAVELTKAKQKYQSVAEKAGERLLAALAEQQKKVEATGGLRVEQQVRLVEQLRLEQRAFAADPASLPKSAGLKKAVSDYQTALATARKPCEAAFDKVAEAYRAKKDFAAAKAVLDEKRLNFVPPAARAFVGTYTWFNGITVVIGSDRTALASNGDTGSWVVSDKQECVLSWRSGFTNFMRLDGDGPNLVENGKGKALRK